MVINKQRGVRRGSSFYNCRLNELGSQLDVFLKKNILKLEEKK